MSWFIHQGESNKEVKSPQIDQSVSSTSDAFPPALTCSVDLDKESRPARLSRSYSEVSDISSVLSPAETEDAKHSDQNQEPSSSMSTTEAPVLQPGSPPDPPCQQMSEIDVTENSREKKDKSEPPELRRRHSKEWDWCVRSCRFILENLDQRVRLMIDLVSTNSWAIVRETLF